MAGAMASRSLRQDVPDVQIGDGEVTVNGTPVADIESGPDGGTITTSDGSTVGFGPEGAGAVPTSRLQVLALAFELL
jgi:hypothetical protein